MKSKCLYSSALSILYIELLIFYSQSSPLHQLQYYSDPDTIPKIKFQFSLIFTNTQYRNSCNTGIDATNHFRWSAKTSKVPSMLKTSRRVVVGHEKATPVVNGYPKLFTKCLTSRGEVLGKKKLPKIRGGKRKTVNTARCYLTGNQTS